MSKFSLRFSLSLSMVLTLGFASVLLLFTSVAVFNQVRIQELSAMDAAARKLTDRQQTALELKLLVQDMESASSGFIISGNQQFADLFNESIPELKRLAETVGATAETREQREWKARMNMVSLEFVQNFEKAAAIAKNNSYSQDQKDSMLTASFNSSQIHKQIIFELVDSFYNDYTTANDEAMKSMADLIENMKTVSLLLSIAGIAVAIGVAAKVIASLTKGIRKLKFGIEQLHQGELNFSLEANDRNELGRLCASFNQSVFTIRTTLAHARSIAESLKENSATFKIAATKAAEMNHHVVQAMEEIAIGSGKQAEQTEISAQSIIEAEARMDSISSSVQLLLQSSAKADSSVQVGVTNIAELESAASRTSGAFRSMSEALERLEMRFDEVGEITNTIQAVAKTTNILSFNAAIEAAYAGQHGKGFAVIAEEVRQLSMQTTESSERIEGIVRQIQSGIRELAQTLRESSESLSDQNRKVLHANQSFDAIAHFITLFNAEVNSIVHRVGEARSKQTELVNSVQVVASVAQQTAAAVEETTAAMHGQDASVRQIAGEAKAVNEIAESLLTEINKFKIA